MAKLSNQVAAATAWMMSSTRSTALRARLSTMSILATTLLPVQLVIYALRRGIVV
jgi:hypothetical protein